MRICFSVGRDRRFFNCDWPGPRTARPGDSLRLVPRLTKPTKTTGLASVAGRSRRHPLRLGQVKRRRPTDNRVQVHPHAPISVVPPPQGSYLMNSIS